jgi:hypothetical protein
MARSPAVLALALDVGLAGGLYADAAARLFDVDGGVETDAGRWLALEALPTQPSASAAPITPNGSQNIGPLLIPIEYQLTTVARLGNGVVILRYVVCADESPPESFLFHYFQHLQMQAETRACTESGKMKVLRRRDPFHLIARRDHRP